MAISSYAWHSMWKADWRVADENHAMEWLQISMLAAAAGAYFIRSYHAAKVVDRFTWAVMMLICLCFMLRELDLELLLPDPVAVLIERGLRIVVVVAWLILGAFAWQHRRELVGNTLLFIKSLPGIFILAGGVLYVIAWPLDRTHVLPLSDRQAMFVEELIECHATMLLLIAAVSNWRKRQLAGDSVTERLPLVTS